MDDNKTEKSSVPGIFFGKETVILLVGLFILGSGFYTGESMQYFFGAVIICGAVVLHLVRKKDWKKHWEEQEMFRQLMEERRKREEEEKK